MSIVPSYVDPAENYDDENGSKNGSSEFAALELLRRHKDRQGHISTDDVVEIARRFGLPPSRIWGLKSFYSLIATGKSSDSTVRVCDGIVCRLNGGDDVVESLQTESQGHGFHVERNSCLGLCDRAPACLWGDKQVGPLSIENPIKDQLSEDAPDHFPISREQETRFLLRRATELHGKQAAFSPVADGYRSVTNAIDSGPEKILEWLQAADLRGCGGAGFSTAQKWRWAAESNAENKVVICNADESEPLSFKDRMLIDVDPHRILEGLLIAGEVIGARRAVIYIRGEYEPQAQKLRKAIAEAGQAGVWKDRMDVTVHRGAGAYICGEETALIESLEGHRGEPRPRPPFPIQSGLYGVPTLVNNVETLAAVAAICDYGIEEFESFGTEGSPGTKLYAVLGHVNNPGLFEAPRGLKLRSIIDDYGGGMKPGSQFSFALTGGAAGTIVDGSRLDDVVDFSADDGVIPMGTGAVLVADDSVSVVWTVRELMHFFESESCGKCTPCRIGTREAREILDRLLAQSAGPDDLKRLKQISSVLSLSLCGLGTSVPMPIDSAMRHFQDQFEACVNESQ